MSTTPHLSPHPAPRAPLLSGAGIARFLQSPLAVVLFICGGVVCGIYAPTLARLLAPIGQTYIGLLKMVVLPFIVSSIIFSIRALIRDPESARYLYRVVLAILVVSFAAVAVAGSLSLALKPGEITDPQARIEFGRVLNRDNTLATDLQMTLAEPAVTVQPPGPLVKIVELVPSNIFGALAAGDTIKVLLFSLLFGLAVGRVPYSVSNSFAEGLDTVYRACIILTRWFNVLLPFASFAMIAEQTASIGVQPLRLMIHFLVVMGLATLVFMAASVAIVSARSGRPLGTTFKAHQTTFMMAIATRSSVACIPSIIDLLSWRLRFSRVVVELLVPLQTALLRAGPIMLYVAGTLFIAQLYGRTLSASDLVLLGFSAVLLGLTTAGMSGVVVLSQMSVLCGYFGLPFEAAFVLFIAVDAVSDTFRTLTLVSTIAAATAAIAPQAEEQDHHVEDRHFAPAPVPGAAE
ncbi:dicarboxylate/amino acid:cation symporter [Ancylobacter terrae]|uniref:dicarboxylate/amino acid:cation symporter n=1 Tax=Ancylobacter sp. sgz301288 TaxID=3342077 RepID=UPI00385C7D10